jgi:hypothetical protein
MVDAVATGGTAAHVVQSRVVDEAARHLTSISINSLSTSSTSAGILLLSLISKAPEAACLSKMSLRNGRAHRAFSRRKVSSEQYNWDVFDLFEY